MIQITKPSILVRVYLLPVTIAIAGCFQIIFIDYPYGHDWIFELVRLEEYYNALKGGQIFPYWAENLYHGFGSPIFLFYAPLYNILSSFILALGASLKSAAIISSVGLMIVSAISMAGLVWEINKKNTDINSVSAARVASIAYVLSPYLLSNLLVRNASAEFTALCLAPIPFWGLVMLKNNRPSGFLFVTAGLSLSILSHNLTALILTAMLVICVVAMFLPEKQYKNLVVALVSIITGTGMTTWFWMPALYLKDAVNIQEMLSGKFDFHNNFTSLINLFGYDSFYATGVFPIAILITGILFIKFKNNNLPLIFLIMTSILFIFLQLSMSSFMWEHLPFMPLFQFPWRMMGAFSFCIAILLGIILSKQKKRPHLVELILIILIIINAAPFLNRYRALPDNISNIISDSITPDGVLINNLPATVLDEYLPYKADKSIINSISAGNVFLEAATSINIISIGKSHLHFTYNSEKNLVLYPAYWNFPVWQAKINNKTIPLSKSSWGTIQLNLPPGEADVELKIIQPAIRKAGGIISGIFIIVFCLFLTRGMKSPLLT